MENFFKTNNDHSLDNFIKLNIYYHIVMKMIELLFF